MADTDVREDRNQTVYELAWEYWAQLNYPGVDRPLIEKYMRLPELTPQPERIEELFERLLAAAQNANMKANVIGGALGGINRLASVLDDFKPHYVVRRYTSWEMLLDEIETELKPGGQIRRTPRSIWPSYCRTIISAARFLIQFESAQDFYRWADFFDNDERARPALPMLLEREVHGIGFALACDFIKGLGYANFAKPDVHLRDIFTGLDLLPAKSGDFELFIAIVRMARIVNETPHGVDKLFWLIGSGNFYEDPDIGNGGRVGRQKGAFIAFAQSRLD